MPQNNDRKLIFANLLNGNDLTAVARVYHKSPKEIEQDFQYISQKIQSYAFERRMPYIACSTIFQARQNRIVLLELLEKINLDVTPVYSRITTSEVKNATDLRC